jgi:hypothetical protein
MRVAKLFLTTASPASTTAQAAAIWRTFPPPARTARTPG